MLYIIGLGLFDYKDITVRGLEAVKSCDLVFLEHYTAVLKCPTEELEKFYEKKIIVADRDLVESEAWRILEPAQTKNVALLVVGDVYGATTEAIKYMLQNPKIAYYKNEAKRVVLEESAQNFWEKFSEYFSSQFVVTTNKKVDNLIERFNAYRLDNEKADYTDLIEKAPQNNYLRVEELNCSDNTFMQTAVGGFSTHKEVYDVALWVDKKRGLYIIPFLETFFKCFEGDVENKDECVRDFLTNDKVPPSVIKYACENYEKFFDVANKALGTEFTNLEEVLFNTKAVYVDSGVFSPVIVLFNSDLFSTILHFEQKELNEHSQDVKRNDPCPCGSGLKYKKCCGKN